MPENNSKRNVSWTVIENGMVVINHCGASYAKAFADNARSELNDLLHDPTRDVHATLETFEDGSYSLTFKSLPK
jgi:hypothetical protein